MVKNTKGGKNSKKIARKHVNDVSNKTMRYISEEGEMYATVVKPYGGQCQVMTTDGELRLCIVRGKFKGRRRRDNNIGLGTWIIIGIREWEVRGDGKTKCDLLYVYNEVEKEHLKQNTKINFSELDKINSETLGVVIDNGVVFRNDQSSEYINETNNSVLDDNTVIKEETEKGGETAQAENEEMQGEGDRIIEVLDTSYSFNIDEI